MAFTLSLEFPIVPLDITIKEMQDRDEDGCCWSRLEPKVLSKFELTLKNIREKPSPLDTKKLV